MKCPNCGQQVEADFVDNGVGMQQCGPYVCLPPGGCGWIEPSPDEVLNDLIKEDLISEA